MFFFFDGRETDFVDTLETSHRIMEHKPSGQEFRLDRFSLQ